jgi:hypothetical protein
VVNRLMLVISVIWTACCLLAQILTGGEVRGKDLLVAALPWAIWLLGLFVVKGPSLGKKAAK